MADPTFPSPGFPPPQPRKSKLPLVLSIIGGALVLLCLAGAVAIAGWWGIRQQHPAENSAKSDPIFTTTSEPKSVAQSDSALATVGKAEASATLDVYEDFMCPACANFEGVYGEQIAEAVAGGKLRVRFHMLNFLDQSSASGDYSSRAAGAALAVFQKAPEQFLAFHTKLLAEDTQPMEGGARDLSNDQLAQIAEGVGAGAAAADIRSGADVNAAKDLAAASIQQLRNITKSVSTPTVLKDDERVDWQHDQQWLQKLVGAP